MRIIRQLLPLTTAAVLTTTCTFGGSENTAASGPSTNASTNTNAASSSSSAAASNVPVVPGYAPGTFPPVPTIVLPDISLLTEGAPSFGGDLVATLANLPGLNVTSAQCAADGSVRTNTALSMGAEITNYGDGSGNYSDEEREIVNYGDGSGNYRDGEKEIVNYGDGSGNYRDGEVEIINYGDGSGVYRDGEKEIVNYGDGSGNYTTDTEQIVNYGDGAGNYTNGTVTIVNYGDGSGNYTNGDLKIVNYGEGEAHITKGNITATVPAEPIAPLGRLGTFPALEVLQPQNICGVLITLESEILFDFDKYDIRPDAHQALKTVASSLSQANPPKVEVIGHTDALGDNAYNQTLSENRANAVVAQLKTDGVTADLTATGKGELVPVAANENADGSDNPSGRQLNRRVEIFIPSFAQ